MKELVFRGRKILSLMAVVSLLVFMTGTATAKTTAKNEKKLTSEISMLNKDASLPRGDQVVMDKLSKEFKVTSDQISALRSKNMGYGEIAAVYAFADKMPGGITDDNINKVTSMVQGKKGWGTIAKSLNVDLGSVRSKVDSIEKDAHKDIKKASAETGTSGAGGGGVGDRGPGRGAMDRGSSRGGY